MLAPYVEEIVAAGQIGVVLTTSEALVHPWGGARPLIGTNPIGIGIPCGDEPLILDMSTAAVSMGRILDYAQRGRSLPPGWASDARGNPTTDARAASAGAIAPFGGPKGYAFGVSLEALVAVLTGTSLGADKRGTLDAAHPSSKGDVFLAIDVARLGLQGSLPALTRYLAQLRDSGIDPERPVLIPGDRARSVRRERLTSGVPIHETVWKQTVALFEAADGGGPARLDEPA
jgi:LDH2 family malate/lactate/ureidoglycolate dehydrogenase